MESCARKAAEVVESLRTSNLTDAARIVEEGFMETLTYAGFPMEHWGRIRTNNGIFRPASLNADIGIRHRAAQPRDQAQDIKRRTKVVASLPDGKPAMMLAAAR